ncbi:hypothetical protein SynBIOSE41_03721 [Synechococcus sp. BIOS-E4-1]|nr:hypothetical protein SynBIOSE41_03721 [Synechococcus sp. BIOS-E4-1]
MKIAVYAVDRWFESIRGVSYSKAAQPTPTALTTVRIECPGAMPSPASECTDSSL